MQLISIKLKRRAVQCYKNFYGHFSVQICNKGKLKEGKRWWERLAKKKARGEVWVYRCRTLQKPLRQIECQNSGHTCVYVNYVCL